MLNKFYPLVRSALFTLSPEDAHAFTLMLLKIFYRGKPAYLPSHGIKCFGLHFPSRIGLAAGLDKDGECLRAWRALGFGFIEVGTVTPLPQKGNPKPRLFRLPRHLALINRMGFNNKGVDLLVQQLRACSLDCPVGVNIGKNRDTPLNQAHQDYFHCFQKVAPFADYVTVNLSSPNTPGLRQLQEIAWLENVLVPLKIAQAKIAETKEKYVPLLVKISPDLEDEEISLIVDTLINLKIDGVIATNTTLSRPTDLKKPEAGGLSGEPLFERSTEIVRQIYRQAGDQLPIVAVGGIASAEHATAKFFAGAKLIQLYTGFIYQGPQLINEISFTLN